MTDLPKRAVQRTARLGSLPLGFAGRAAVGWGRRLTGADSEELSADMIARNAEHLFTVLGELKGGAMKVGQALSVYEAMIPAQLAEPYREALTKLQTAGPAMPASKVHRVLTEQLGSKWQHRFQAFDDQPAAAASIGQVHRAVWHDGREVAVKVQYPGAGEALMSDLRQLQRFARLFQLLVPGLDARALLRELRERMSEELDYRREAEDQRAFAAALADDPRVRVPGVVASAPKALVVEWLSGTPLSAAMRHPASAGAEEQATRDRLAETVMELHFSSPARIGLLHADPHPGNFLLLDDGRLGVIDFGATARLPQGIPRPLGQILRLAADQRGEALLELLRAQGFVGIEDQVGPQDALDYIGALADPLRVDRFHFSPSWMRAEGGRVTDLGGPDFHTGRALNLPPHYLLVLRVVVGWMNILAQFDCTAAARQIVVDWVPGFTD